MQTMPSTASFFNLEARALLSRLGRVKPFSLIMPSVASASITPEALYKIEKHLTYQSRLLHQRIRRFLEEIEKSSIGLPPPEALQRKFVMLKLEFNTTLDQLDVFSDVLTQRSEHENGVWLAGLDAMAADALKTIGEYYEPPPVVTYLERGHGAAIRRVRTRLPGGAKNPVTVIRIPRERMVGSGIGSSLVHEVGHQAAALLDLVKSFRLELINRQQNTFHTKPAWVLYERWASEILADFWSVAQIGVAASLGLIGVVSLPSAFIYRLNLKDPHPFPWIRVLLSLGIGRALYPDPQWGRLSKLWLALYPIERLSLAKRRLICLLMHTIPDFVRVLINHKPKALRGRSLREVIPVKDRQPFKLRRLFADYQHSPSLIKRFTPMEAFAILGQARFDGRITPENESETVSQLLTRWALKRAVPIDVYRQINRGTIVHKLVD